MECRNLTDTERDFDNMKCTKELFKTTDPKNQPFLEKKTSLQSRISAHKSHLQKYTKKRYS